MLFHCSLTPKPWHVHNGWWKLKSHKIMSRISIHLKGISIVAWSRTVHCCCQHCWHTIFCNDRHQSVHHIHCLCRPDTNRWVSRSLAMAWHLHSMPLHKDMSTFHTVSVWEHPLCAISWVSKQSAVRHNWIFGASSAPLVWWRWIGQVAKNALPCCSWTHHTWCFEPGNE